MRRQDVQLLALARQGDHDALCEVGLRYLKGAKGFPKYTELGLEYLSHQGLSKSDRAPRIIAESLPLGELVQRSQLIALTSAAHLGSRSACLKLGVWRALTRSDPDSARRMWSQASQMGCENASRALDAYHESPNPLLSALAVLVEVSEVDVSASVSWALAQAVSASEVPLLLRNLEFAVALPVGNSPALCDAVCDAMMSLQRLRTSMPALDGSRLQSILEDCVRRGNSAAALILGRAMCGIDTAFADSTNLAPKRNLRGGTALLLRAADAGMSDAWLLLHHVHADGQGSVAKPLPLAPSRVTPCGQSPRDTAEVLWTLRSPYTSPVLRPTRLALSARTRLSSDGTHLLQQDVYAAYETELDDGSQLQLQAAQLNPH